MLVSMPLYPPSEASQTALIVPFSAGSGGGAPSLTVERLQDELGEMLRDLDGVPDVIVSLPGPAQDAFESRANQLKQQMASLLQQLNSNASSDPMTTMAFDAQRGRLNQALVSFHAALDEALAGHGVNLGALRGTTDETPQKNKKFLFAALGGFVLAGLSVALYVHQSKKRNLGNVFKAPKFKKALPAR